MKGAERPVVVADFELDAVPLADLPTGADLVDAAARSGCDRVAVHVHATADGWAVTHPRAEVVARDGTKTTLADLSLAETRDVRVARGRRIATLEETMLAAHRKRLGLVLRIQETFVIEGLVAGLNVLAGEGPTELRRRYLVVVPDGRIGQRLRREARELPSALEISASGGGLRAAITRRFPNFARAAADADDLVMPMSLASPERVRTRLAPVLARRGAHVWIANMTNERREEYEKAGAGGLLLRLPWID